MTSTVKNTKDLQVLTPSGWSHFSGVLKKKSKTVIKLICRDGTSISCTPDHKLKTDSGFVEAITIRDGDVLLTSGGVTTVSFVDMVEDPRDVYDLLDVSLRSEYFTNDLVSHNCEFMGSSGTLISGAKLKQLAGKKPLAESHDGLRQYTAPRKERAYVMTCDVSRGKGLDYSAFHVFDVTEMPYVQACTFRSNVISPGDYSKMIDMVGRMYNEAAVLVEINDIGGQVSESLHFEHEYDNVVFTENAGRVGKRISAGFGGKNVDKGIRTTSNVKNVGCSMLKLLVEGDKLIINDMNTIQELYTFSLRGSSFEAESGNHDDLVMGLVLFSWMSEQRYFKELTDINTMKELRERTDDELEQDMLPFGFVIDGQDDQDKAPVAVTMDSFDRMLI